MKGEEEEETGGVRGGSNVKRGRVVQKQKQKWVWLLHGGCCWPGPNPGPSTATPRGPGHSTG